jgi:hypothetical protein
MIPEKFLLYTRKYPIKIFSSQCGKNAVKIRSEMLYFFKRRGYADIVFNIKAMIGLAIKCEAEGAQ